MNIPQLLDNVVEDLLEMQESGVLDEEVLDNVITRLQRLANEVEAWG